MLYFFHISAVSVSNINFAVLWLGLLCPLCLISQEPHLARRPKNRFYISSFFSPTNTVQHFNSTSHILLKWFISFPPVNLKLGGKSHVYLTFQYTQNLTGPEERSCADICYVKKSMFCFCLHPYSVKGELGLFLDSGITGDCFLSYYLDFLIFCR